MKIRDQGTVFDTSREPPNARSCAFTSVAYIDGALLVAFRNATGRDAPDGRLRVMRSFDEGRTWETFHAGMNRVLNGVLGNYYVAYFSQFEPGRMLGVFKWVDRSDPTLSFVNPVTTGILPMRSLLAESTDAGQTWGDHHVVDMRPHTGAGHTGPLFQLPGGRLALPYERWKDYDDDSPGQQAALLRLSSDGGQTWPDFAVVARDPNARIMYWDQRIARHPSTGRLVAMFWTHDRDRGEDIANHITWGTPDGLTWTPPTPTPLHGQHCEPIALGGDLLLAVYVHRRDPPTLRAVLSYDFGRTWALDTETIFYDSRVGTEPGMRDKPSFEEFWQSMMAWRFGHPRGVLLPNGDVFVAYYAGDAASTSIHWVRLDPERPE